MAQCAVIWLNENNNFLACTRPSNSANATVFLASFSVWKAKAALARLSLDSAYSIAKQPLTIHTRRLVQIAATRTRTPSIERIANFVKTHFSAQSLHFYIWLLVYGDYVTRNRLVYSAVFFSIVFVSIFVESNAEFKLSTLTPSIVKHWKHRTKKDLRIDFFQWILLSGPLIRWMKYNIL